MRCLRSLSMVPDPIQKCLFDDFVDSFITRTQRLAQRLLKRNLGDRTWNSGEISSELTRLNDDVQNYLSVHTVSNILSPQHHSVCLIFNWKVRTLDLIHS